MYVFTTATTLSEKIIYRENQKELGIKWKTTICPKGYWAQRERKRKLQFEMPTENE